MTNAVLILLLLQGSTTTEEKKKEVTISRVLGSSGSSMHLLKGRGIRGEGHLCPIRKVPNCHIRVKARERQFLYASMQVEFTWNKEGRKPRPDVLTFAFALTSSELIAKRDKEDPKKIVPTGNRKYDRGELFIYHPASMATRSRKGVPKGYPSRFYHAVLERGALIGEKGDRKVLMNLLNLGRHDWERIVTMDFLPEALKKEEDERKAGLVREFEKVFVSAAAALLSRMVADCEKGTKGRFDPKLKDTTQILFKPVGRLCPKR